MLLTKIKNTFAALFILSVLVLTSNIFAQSGTNSNGNGNKGTTNSQNKGTLQHGPGFVDANGDGICDHAIDTNGDGIPDQKGNAQRPMDGTGKKHGMGKGHGMSLKGGGQGTGTCNGTCDGTGPKGKMGKK